MRSTISFRQWPQNGSHDNLLSTGASASGVSLSGMIKMLLLSLLLMSAWFHEKEWYIQSDRLSFTMDANHEKSNRTTITHSLLRFVDSRAPSPPPQGMPFPPKPPLDALNYRRNDTVFQILSGDVVSHYQVNGLFNQYHVRTFSFSPQLLDRSYFSSCGTVLLDENQEIPDTSYEKDGWFPGSHVWLWCLAELGVSLQLLACWIRHKPASAFSSGRVHGHQLRNKPRYWKRWIGFFLILATSPTLCLSSSADETTPTTLPRQNRNNPTRNPQKDDSLFVLCSLDGTIYSLDAWSGEFRASSRTGVPLITRSQPFHDNDNDNNKGEPLQSNGMIHPGLDGKLYWQSPDEQELQALPVSIPSLLEHPVRSCNADNDCGILTAVAHNTMLALDTETGTLQWSSSVLGETGLHRDAPPSTTSHRVLLQRKDFAIQHISTVSGKQVWNVTMGSYQAVDFDPLVPQQTTPSSESKRIDQDDDESNDFVKMAEDSIATLPLPVLRFGKAGRELTAYHDHDHETILWRVESPHVLTSVFGIQHHRWREVSLLEEEPTDSDDENDEYDNTIPYSRRLPSQAQSQETDYSQLWHQHQQQQQWQWRSLGEQGMAPKSLPLSPRFPKDPEHCMVEGTCPNMGYGTHHVKLLPSPPQDSNAQQLFNPNANQPPLPQSTLEILIVAGVAIGFLLFLLVLFYQFILRDHHGREKTALSMTATTSTSHERSSSDPITSCLSFPGAVHRRKPVAEMLSDFPLHTQVKAPVQSDPGETQSSPGDPSPPRQLDTVGTIPLVQYSRYASEFEELEALGRGGFGSVFRCRNKLDGLDYAIKKVLIRSEAHRFEQELSRVLREVKVLAVLDHPNIVRYFTAWLETDKDDDEGDSKPSKTQISRSSWSGDETNQSFTRSSIHAQDTSSESHLHRMRDWMSASKSNWKEQQEAAAMIAASMGDDCGIIFEDSTVQEGLNQPNPLSHSERLSASPYATSDALGNKNGQDSKLHKSAKPQADSEKTNNHIHQSPAEPATKHTLFIQMQLCRFDTVADFLINKEARQVSKELSMGEHVDIVLALSLLIQIAKAVQHVHNKGLIHRDLKPSNCFMDKSGVVKVGDFGLSRETSDQTDRANAVITPVLGPDLVADDNHTAGVGTRLYASPEQTEGSSYDASTDVYSLGIILFELVYPMYTGMERNICLSKLRQMLQFPSDWSQVVGSQYSDQIKRLVQSMLNPQPCKRPSAAGVVQQINDLLGELTILSPIKPKQNQKLVLLRVESALHEDILQQVLAFFRDDGADILQSGMAQEGEVMVMEFAINCQSNPRDILKRLEASPNIVKVRQVSAHHHYSQSSPEQPELRKASK